MPKKKGKRFSIHEEYLSCFKYIKESKKFIFAIIGIFFIFALIGFFLPVPNSIASFITNYIKELSSQIDGMSLFQLIFFILSNNVKSSLFGLIFGILLGIFPLFVSLFNGYVLGFVANESVKADGVLVLLRLLPHGIFELPAVFISLGIGIKLGSLLISKQKNVIGKNFIQALKVFFFIVIPLLIIAAVIEGSLIFLSR